MRVAHLDVVTKDVVICYLERGDTRKLALALLQRTEVVLAMQCYAAQVIQLCRHT